MFVGCLNPKPFKLAAEVDYLSSFKINWQASFNKTNKWHDMNSTSNELYLTLKDGGSEAFETVLHIGCKNAKGQTKDAAVVSAIWSEFTDCKVNTKAGERLYYYKNGKYTSYIKTKDLLQYKNGQCGAWAVFFQDVLRIQNITVNRAQVISEGNYPFYMKDWKVIDGAQAII